MINSENILCSECAGLIITDNNRGEITCHACGLVQSTLIASGKEWRAYNNMEDKQRSRVGDPDNPLFADSLSASLGRNQAYDTNGNKIPDKKRKDFERLAKLDYRRSSKMKNLRIALRELQRLTSHLSIGETVARTASIYYRRVLRANLLRGRSIDGMIAASLYIACRKEEIPITIKDINFYTEITQKELSRYVRILIEHFQLQPSKIAPAAFIHRLGGILNMTMQTISIGVQNMEQAYKTGINVGKHPMSIAAAALYLAGVQTGERRTQEQLAKAARTTPVTIRNRSRELMAVLELDIQIKRGPVSSSRQIATAAPT